MKIVNKLEFYRLPAGTLYSEFEPICFNGLKIKGDTIFYGEDEPSDFWYEDLIGNVESSDSDDFAKIITNAMEDKISFDLDFNCTERDGLYEDDGLYAIYEEKDLLGLISKLHSLIK